MFENSKINLRKWFLSIWLVTAHKKGISSLQLSKDIGVTQKTAWFMLQRIRACFGIENSNELEGVVECDETFIGGKNKNRHKDKKVPQSQGRSYNHVSKKHLQLYVDEFVYRFNLRKFSDQEKFRYTLLHSDVRAKYHELVQ